MLHSALGKVTRYDDGTLFLVTNEGEAGCVLFGPYQVLEPGSYEVEFYAMAGEMNNSTACVVDVLRQGRTIVAEKDFTASELILRNGVVLVRFEVVKRDTFEFRLTASGTAALTVRYTRPVRRLPTPGQDNAVEGGAA